MDDDPIAPPATRATKLAQATRWLFSWLVGTLGLLLVALGTAFLVHLDKMPTLLLVLLVGTIGGFVGLQRRLPALSEADLDLLTGSKITVGLAPVTGGILAMLLYVLFLSGIISGGLFPKFVPDDGCPPADFTSLFHTHAESYVDYAKLVVWSFVAGFSERFVTDILGRLQDHPDPPPGDPKSAKG